jgi:hypothetical protein
MISKFEKGKGDVDAIIKCVSIFNKTNENKSVIKRLRGDIELPFT